MRYQVFLLITLVVSLSTGLFAATQIFNYFTQKQIVLGAWNNETSEIVFAQEQGGEGENMRVLGASSSETVIVPEATSKSFQGHIFDLYFAQQDSPLYGYGEHFVEACRTYGAPEDCTLLPAIAKVETNFCKTDISAQQFNCWGWGGSGPNRILFNSFPQAIDTITRRLMIGYGERFFNDANFGGLTYCGRHCVNWGNYVEEEKRRIDRFFESNGYSDLL
jgi:hypothetical protein